MFSGFLTTVAVRPFAAAAAVASVMTATANPSIAASATPTADQILALGRAAVGGDALASLRSVHYKQKVVLVGIAGTGEQWDDVVSGRTISIVRAGPASASQGFDGTGSWQQDATGLTHAIGGYADVTSALTQAYFTSFSEFMPGRRAGTIADPRVVTKAGTVYDILTITPRGGLPTDVYFDAATHLIARLVTRYSPSVAFQTEYSDYRTVDGVAIPFSIQSQDSNGNAASTVVTSAIANSGSRESYAMPATRVRDFSISKGTSTTIPIELINNHIYLNARVDGKGPYRFIFDTGGQALLDPDVAASLGIGGSGSLNASGAGAGTVQSGIGWVPSIELGNATLTHQSAGILPLGPTMQAIEGVHIDGMVGWEVAARYLVTIDYLHRTLTLAIRQPGIRPAGAAVPFTFDQSIPEIHAAADGLFGLFDIDTGNRQSLVLTSPFVARHGLLAKYPSNIAGVTGYGLGGPSSARLTRIRALQVAGLSIPDVISALSLDTSGAMADPGQAGNIGGGFLKRFTVTLDYADRVMYLSPNADFAKRETYDRCGLVLVAGSAGIRAIGVLSGTPASDAGVKPGDRLLSVNGADAKTLGLIRIRQMLSGPAGTRVRLRLRSPAGVRALSLTLRDYV